MSVRWCPSGVLSVCGGYVWVFFSSGVMSRWGVFLWGYVSFPKVTHGHTGVNSIPFRATKLLKCLFLHKYACDCVEGWTTGGVVIMINLRWVQVLVMYCESSPWVMLPFNFCMHSVLVPSSCGGPSLPLMLVLLCQKVA